MSWSVVVPVKGPRGAKTRLALGERTRAELAVAFALDTVAAALAARHVGRVLVITGADIGEAFRALGAEVLIEQERRGLTAAIADGLAHVGDGPRAVLLGDVPALRAAELDAALTAAGAHPLAFVPDADGVGTVLATAASGVPHDPRFGPGSREAHRAAGYVELELPVDWGLRRDVDTTGDLDRVLTLGIGPHTRRAVEHRATA
ncbi:2-phospho-L-lactate guanylyltransferase [Diaminobutyricimonas aerilata]|uniref:2-phospho-L-lactate guanylyltransferase n=1 Tax=Diaminobutyricimonas aerilata TaxID=1162967 RepID=UPI001473CE28|nr:2-phospho-L-lactate guanylyltransferase [Diaminobutyricimonas aerilata]